MEVAFTPGTVVSYTLAASVRACGSVTGVLFSPDAVAAAMPRR